MLNYLNDIVDRHLLPNDLKRDDQSLHKAKVLSWLHLLSILISGTLVGASFLLSPQQALPILSFNLIAFLSAYFYKKFGNTLVSGNILVSLLFCLLLSNMLSTGGLYSDNLLWMLVGPVMAYLLTTKTWGFVWSSLSIFIIIGLYVIELKSPEGYRANSLIHGPDYFLVSYIGLFVTLSAIITIFVKGNENLLRALKSTSRRLLNRSKQLEQKNKLLLEKETELKRSNQDLELLAKVASHDLKEPLRMINVYAKFLEKNIGDSLSPRDQEYLTYIREGGTRMNTMLEDLLAFGKLGHEKMNEGNVDLNQMLLVVQNNLKLRLLESKGSISWSTLPVIHGRTTHMIQLFQNLIANSLKFRRPEVDPKVFIEGKEFENEYKISISDNGIGIPDKDLNNIFKVFERVESSKNFEGSGIGLATVERIMEGLEGSIHLESELNVGTTFTLSFPTKRIISTTAAIGATVSAEA